MGRPSGWRSWKRAARRGVAIPRRYRPDGPGCQLARWHQGEHGGGRAPAPRFRGDRAHPGDLAFDGHGEGDFGNLAFDGHGEGDFRIGVGKHGLVIKEEEGGRSIELKFEFYFFLESSRRETPFLVQDLASRPSTSTGGVTSVPVLETTG